MYACGPLRHSPILELPMSLLRTPFKLPLALFLCSAVIGVWASYDPQTSQEKLLLIGAAIALYLVIANLGGSLRTAAVWAALVPSAAFAIYFATQHDYALEPGKLAILTAIGQFLNRAAPHLDYHVPQSNIAAGLLEVSLPIGAALALQRLRDRNWIELALALTLCVVIAFGLVMTSSRGALLALGLVAVGSAGLFVVRSIFERFHLPSRLWIPLAFNALLIGVLLLIHFWDDGRLLDSVGGIMAGGGRGSRLEVYRQSVQLIQDYPFTGGGLGVFPMVFSTYALLIDNPFLPHSHNLFLQIWIEQGLLGFVSFVWLVLAFYLWVWQRRDRLNWIAAGGLAAMTVLLLHGFLDVLFYSSRFLPLLLVPVGLTVAGMRQRRAGRAAWTSLQFRFAAVASVVGLTALLTIFLLEHDPILAVWYQNMGSVEETKTELVHYHYQDSLVEYIRRQVDLSEAEADFHHALLLDGHNVGANQRLASIALAQGRYSRALDYAQAAAERDPQNDVTRELLAEAYLGVGQMENAFTYWSLVGDAAGRLERLSHVRYEREGDAQGAHWALALADRIRARQSQ